MRYSREHSEQTRRRVLDAAGRAFRAHGFGEIGVDGLAKAAGVTSGAFYNHFHSKAAAFRAAVVAGLEHLRLAVEQFRAEHGAGWFDAFAHVYLSREHRRDLPGGCALPSLSAEVGRAAPSVRAEYEAELLRVAAAMAAGLPGNARRTAAWPLLAQLAGGVLLARAVQDEALAAEIADSVLDAVRAQARGDPGA